MKNYYLFRIADMPKKLLIALALLLSIAPFPAYSQTLNQNTIRPATIDGSIILPTNQPIMERYEILLLLKDSNEVISRTYTDLSGRYSFTNLTTEAVDVVVRIEGFDEARVPVRLTPGRIVGVPIFLTMKARTVIDADTYDSSVVRINELSRKFPKKAVADFQKALESKHKGDPAKSQELLEGVVKLAPDFPDAHNLLGTVYQGMDRYRDAERQYNMARDLSPGSVAPLINLAILYLQEAEANEKEGPYVTGVMYDDSLHSLQDANRVEPRNPTVYYLFGVLFYRAHSYRFAEVSLNEAISINVQVGRARLALANVYIRQQKWKEALDQFDKYLAENPKATDRSQVEAVRTKVIEQL